MVKVSTYKKSFTNDRGDVVNYNVLQISGSVNGQDLSVEKSITAPEATIIGMITNSKEDLHVTTKRGGEVNVDEESWLE